MLRDRCTFPLVVLIALSVGCDTRETQPPPSKHATPEPEPPAPASESALPMHLVGTIDIPGGVSLRYFAKIEAGENGPTGTVSIPEQGAKDLELANILVTEDAVTFELAPVNAKWTGAIEGDAIACLFEQGGMKIDCKMQRVTAEQFASRGTGARPQEPKPPFPYDEEEVAYDNGDVKLAGTLTLPKGGPHATALLISGSGAQDRNEEVFDHKPFWVLADHLSRKGIAVLRVDDRGVGGSTGQSPDVTMMDFAADVKAGIAFLRKHDRVDPKKVGLVGHSEGGAVAVRVAATDAKLAFVVTLAGPGVNGGDMLVAQVEALAIAEGASKEQAALAGAQEAKAVAIIRKTPDPARAKAALLEVFDPEGRNREALEPQLAAIVSPWFRTLVLYEPAKDFAKLRMPVLALNGALDVQVVADQNIPAIEKALARNKKAKVQRLEGLNHLFQHARTGSPGEYGTIEETIDPAVLDLVAGFIDDAT